MATTKTQRYGIMIILIALVLGTIGGFAVMILSTQTSKDAAAKFQKATEAYRSESDKYQKLVQEQADDLSKKYYPAFKKYENYPKKFDIHSVKKLETKDLTDGDGAKIDGSTSFAAYYIGWDANGRIFDQSIDTSAKKLKTPLSVSTGLDTASLIDGWKKGMKGMHIGGVRLITIPSDLAYGEKGQGADIAPNMPLKFIVMAIPTPAQIPYPDSYTDAINAYQEAYSAYAATQ